jgi:hypothetical protein
VREQLAPPYIQQRSLPSPKSGRDSAQTHYAHAGNRWACDYRWHPPCCWRLSRTPYCQSRTARAIRADPCSSRKCSPVVEGTIDREVQTDRYHKAEKREHISACLLSSNLLYFPLYFPLSFSFCLFFSLFSLYSLYSPILILFLSLSLSPTQFSLLFYSASLLAVQYLVTEYTGNLARELLARRTSGRVPTVALLEDVAHVGRKRQPIELAHEVEVLLGLLVVVVVQWTEHVHDGGFGDGVDVEVPGEHPAAVVVVLVTGLVHELAEFAQLCLSDTGVTLVRRREAGTRVAGVRGLQVAVEQQEAAVARLDFGVHHSLAGVRVRVRAAVPKGVIALIQEGQSREDQQPAVGPLLRAQQISPAGRRGTRHIGVPAALGHAQQLLLETAHREKGGGEHLLQGQHVVGALHQSGDELREACVLEAMAHRVHQRAALRQNVQVEREQPNLTRVHRK